MCSPSIVFPQKQLTLKKVEVLTRGSLILCEDSFDAGQTTLVSLHEEHDVIYVNQMTRSIVHWRNWNNFPQLSKTFNLNTENLLRQDEEVVR